MPFRQGYLIVTDLYPIKDTPTSSDEAKIPTLHRLRLAWEPQYIKTEGPLSIKSTSFSLRGKSTKAFLELKFQSDWLCLYLQVGAMHEDGIFGRALVHVDGKSLISDCIISKTNVENGNTWNLPIPAIDVSNCYDKRMFNFVVDMEVMVIDCNQKQEFAPKELKMSKDLASMLSDGDSTDITLKVGTTELRAHKFMLSARSPVLKTMLSADMLEGRTGVIELKNMSEAAATAFLSFIYSARVNEQESEGTVEELLVAAAMYDMPDLFAYTEFALRKIINVENVGRLLLLACLHDAIKLKLHAFTFFKSNKAAVTASQGWKEVVAANPTVMFEAIMDIV